MSLCRAFAVGQVLQECCKFSTLLLQPVGQLLGCFWPRGKEIARAKSTRKDQIAILAKWANCEKVGKINEKEEKASLLPADQDTLRANS